MSNNEPLMEPVDDLPDIDRTNFDWAKVAETCRANPGKWFKVFVQRRTTLYESARGQNVNVVRRDRGFTYRTRNTRRHTTDTGSEYRTCDMFVRYDPENDIHKD